MVRFRVFDSVCGAELSAKTAKYVSFYDGHTHYFCDRACKMEFDKNPDKYLQPTRVKVLTSKPL